MGAGGSQDLRSSSPIMAPKVAYVRDIFGRVLSTLLSSLLLLLNILEALRERRNPRIGRKL